MKSKIGLTHLKYKIKYIRWCDWFSILNSRKFDVIDFSVQQRKSYKERSYLGVVMSAAIIELDKVFI